MTGGVGPMACPSLLMQNIEFKAELRNLEAARQQCRLLGPSALVCLCSATRIFGWRTAGSSGARSMASAIQWVYYHRPDRVSPRMSNYTILTDVQAKRRWGTRSLKPWLVVDKTRELWTFGELRINLDVVKGLGTFLEFEAVVSRRFNVKACHELIARLRESFAPLLGEPISVSYSDLMQAQLADAV